MAILGRLSAINIYDCELRIVFLYIASKLQVMSRTVSP